MRSRGSVLVTLARRSSSTAAASRSAAGGGGDEGSIQPRALCTHLVSSSSQLWKRLCVGAHTCTMDASDPPRGLSGGAVLAFLSFVNMWNYIVRSHHMLLHSFFLPCSSLLRP